jgi:peptide/nickel transport system substrate-binding protein
VFRVKAFRKSIVVLFLVTLALGVSALKPVTASSRAAELPQIVVTWWSEPSNLDLHSFGTDGDSDARQSSYATLIDRKLVEGPFKGTTLAQTGSYVGVLADSWKVDDATKSITFTLKKGLKFSSGNPVTAEDVRYTFERGMKSPTSYMGSLMSLAGIDDPSQVKVVDDLTIQLNTKHGVTQLLYELLSIVNMGIVDEKAVAANATKDNPYATDWLRTHTAGAGPYVLKTLKPGVEFDYAPNPNYFDAANFPKNGGIAIKVIPTAADRILLLKQGEVDVLRGVPFSEIDDLKKSDGIQVLSYPSTDTRAIGMDNKIKPFDNVKVRQAIAYAIPYADIIKAVYSGYATQLKSSVPAGMPTSDFSFWAYDTNVDKAKALLAEAGFPNGFETTLFTRADNQDDQQIAVLVQDSLRKIGVKVNIEKLLSGAYADRQFNKRDLPMFFFDWISYVNDPFYNFHWLVRCGMGTNYADFCDKSVDALIDQGLFETDAAKREAISKQIQKMQLEASPWIFLAQPNSVTAMRTTISGWAQYPDIIARYATLTKGQ